jgi:hypothetical protein
VCVLDGGMNLVEITSQGRSEIRSSTPGVFDQTSAGFVLDTPGALCSSLSAKSSVSA